MNKNRECEEIIKDTNTGLVYRFAGTMGMIKKVGLAGRDPSFINSDLSDGLLPVGDIENIIKFSMEQINGKDVDDSECEKLAIEFMEAAGLQDSSLLARMMISHAMAGSIKKKQIRILAEIQGAVFKSNRSPWMIFLLLGLSLAGSLAGLIALACMIYSYL